MISLNISEFASAEMKLIINLAKRVATYPSTVLITGETGVGKEVLASLIHQHSNRVNDPFIKINCGAIPESLLESELFGYEPGAFTGARREGSQGLFEAANNGTLLLDEISELPPKAQSKLLRALQEKEIRKVGGTWSKTVDVRIIAATNQDLFQLVSQGLFRQDLYYRLNVIHLEIPPLRKRSEDIEILLNHFLNLFGNEFGLTRRFTASALAEMKNYHWPGNVRELRNVIEYLLVTTEKETIAVNDLPADIINNRSSSEYISSLKICPLKEVVEQAEKLAITNALDKCDNTRNAAELLEIDYTTLMRKINKLDIKR